ncbi:hypothetical protein J0S82_016568, partial [Galemys pyrenaicus]
CISENHDHVFLDLAAEIRSTRDVQSHPKVSGIKCWFHGNCPRNYHGLDQPFWICVPWVPPMQTLISVSLEKNFLAEEMKLMGNHLTNLCRLAGCPGWAG